MVKLQRSCNLLVLYFAVSSTTVVAFTRNHRTKKSDN